jgi:hypothetical protein
VTETVRPPAFGGARRVVVKIGSAVLSDGGAFDRVTFVSLVRDLVRLRQQGVELVVVSSGAVALGMERMGLTSRPKELPALQATAAIGQGRLMRLWEDELGHYGLRAAQVLLTHDDLRSRSRFLAARQTLRTVLELGAVPVVNENDTVAVEEIKMGDNDLLSGQMVSLVGAECVVICAQLEAELAVLGSEERAQFLTEMGLEEPGLNRFIRAGYKLLGLATYFTAGPKECRAWTIPIGATAPQAASVIHTDFERGFIRAEVIAYEDYIAGKGEAGAQAAGKLRLEGKEYIVRDGDVMHFRFNV